MTTDVANLVRRLADRLEATPSGQLVSYDELSEAIGQDVRAAQTRQFIYKAMTLAEQEIGAKFKTVHRMGYQRLKNNELVKIGQTARRRIRGTARRANKGIAAGVRVANDLTADEMNALLREQTALGLLEHFAKDKALPKVDASETRPLTPGQAARQFLQSVGALKGE